jgi:glutamate formiminotransferase/formiminotetrahydrofolate cyclodeaminase
MPTPLVECVPNFSEGRDPATIDALRSAISGVASVQLLDVQTDASHNRSVFTFVAPPDAAVDAALAAMRVATKRIDLTKHSGEHPRMGATDVVPFVPVEDVTMDDCVALARRLGEQAAKELAIPVFLYARAAARSDRVLLPDVRKGEFEGMRGRELDRTLVRTASIRPPVPRRLAPARSSSRSTCISTPRRWGSPRQSPRKSAHRVAGCPGYRRAASSSMASRRSQ